MAKSDLCPCQSGATYEECCEKIITKKQSAATPEMLMRSRYTAYVKGISQHIINTTHADHRDDCDEESINEWSTNAQWHGLEIVHAEENGDEGRVEFIANFSEKGIGKKHHEKSIFKKVDGEWFFDRGSVVLQKMNKIGRNDPCSCESGKKYKKCCGR